jgi:hypothetical protein
VVVAVRRRGVGRSVSRESGGKGVLDSEVAAMMSQGVVLWDFYTYARVHAHRHERHAESKRCRPGLFWRTFLVISVNGCR